MRSSAAAILTIRQAAVTGSFIAVAALHCLAIFTLYRGRVVAHWSMSDSDFVIFDLPALIAFASYLFLLAGVMKRIGARLVCAILLTFLSAWAGFVVAFNTYGT